MDTLPCFHGRSVKMSSGMSLLPECDLENHRSNLNSKTNRLFFHQVTLPKKTTKMIAVNARLWWLISLVHWAACCPHPPDPLPGSKGVWGRCGPVCVHCPGGFAHTRELLALSCSQQLLVSSVVLLPKLWLVLPGVWWMNWWGHKQINLLHYR